MNRMDLTKFKRTFGHKTNAELAEMFGIEETLVAELGVKHSLGKDRRLVPREKMPRWTEAEIEKLRLIYSDRSNEDIAAEMGRSAIAVLCKAYRMRLEKSKAYLSTLGQINVSVRHSPGQ
jgi:hypothetical protein